MVRRHPRRSLTTALAAAALTVALGGCESGAGGEDPSGSPAPGSGEVREVPGQVVEADGLAISADGTRVAAGCRDDLCVWDTRDGALLGAWDGGRVVAFSPDGELVATDGMQSNRALVRLLDADGEELLTLPGHAMEEVQDGVGTGITDLAFSPEGDLLASAGRDGTVRLWSMPDGQPVASLETAGDSPDALAFAPDGSRLAVAQPDGPVEVFDVDSGEPVGTLGDEPQGTVAWSPEGGVLATATRAPGDDARGRLWDAASLEETGGGFAPQEAYELAFAPDGGEVAVTRKDVTEVELWPVTDGEVATLRGHREPPRAVVWSPDGRTLYTASTTEGVLAWDPSGGKPLRFELPPE